MKTTKKHQKSKVAKPSAKRESWILGITDVDLKRLLIDRSKLNPTTIPSAKGPNRHREVPSFIFMRPVCSGYDCDVPDPDDDRPPKDPCAGQTWVWQPDLAAQLNLPEDINPTAADLKRIENGLGGNLSAFSLPDPDVRVSLNGKTILIMVWGNRVPSTSCSERARQRASLPDLADGGNFGIYVNAGLIRRLADRAFQNAPKQLDSNGAPSPFGPVHLTNLDIGFKSPNTIETYIFGYDERPWPDVSFKQTIKDTLRSLRRCETQTDLSTSSGVNVVVSLILVALSVAVPAIIPFTAFVLFVNIDAALNSSGGDEGDGGDGGVGCRLLKSLPNEIPLPQTGGIAPPIAFSTAKRSTGRVTTRSNKSIRVAAKTVGHDVLSPTREKLVVAYFEPHVDSRGLFVGGFTSPQPRVPAIRIHGPANLSFYSNGSETFGYFSVEMFDFFGGRLISWSASGQNSTVANPGSRGTRITFRRGNAKPGDTFDRTVTVRVTDSEGSTVSASKTVTFFVSEPDSLPPICQIRPWLPECNKR